MRGGRPQVGMLGLTAAWTVVHHSGFKCAEGETQEIQDRQKLLLRYSCGGSSSGTGRLVLQVLQVLEAGAVDPDRFWQTRTWSNVL